MGKIHGNFAVKGKIFGNSYYLLESKVIVQLRGSFFVTLEIAICTIVLNLELSLELQW